MSRRLVLMLLPVAAALALAFSSWGEPAAAARAWLCAFVLISMVPIGSLALLLVWGISGGRWGEDLAPVLDPAARTIPLLAFAFLPVIVFRSLIYDWHALNLPHDVRSYYLNPLFFDVRTLIGLAIWSLLAWTGAWRNQLFAALGLVAHFILMTFLPADWVLTIAPGSTSAGFGMGFGVEQMFAALGFVAVLAWQAPGRASRDLAGILVTTLLGAVYFFYMAFLITWYGNIPEKVHWYAARAGKGWPLVMLASFLIGAAAPFLAILSPYIRRQPSALRVVGVLVLVGVVLHVGWMMLPSFGASAIAPGMFATALLALLLTAAALISPAPRRADGR
jgi:hypothetical protein